VIRFDLSSCPRFRYPEDFDRDKYRRWLELSGISGRPRTEDVLVNIEAAERAGGKLLFRNAGVLFFAKNVRRFFNQAYITCLLAKGTDKVNILDRKDFDGGIVADIEDALLFIERNTRTAYRIERLIRENIPEYPMKGLREAITNAVMHRDWFIEGANVFVEIYTDRIEVVSPGALPRGMTLDDLGTKSVRRNALIADLLHRIGFIEKAGTGVGRIRDEAREGGYPEPEWRADGFVTAVFRPNPEVRAYADTWATTQVPDKHPTSTRQVLAVLAEAREPLPRATLQEASGLRNREHFVGKHLNPLVAAGLIEMTIPDKPRSSRQRYRLTAAGRDFLTRHEEPE
jgi:ATP-dependent DNA helicase RecG